MHGWVRHIACMSCVCVCMWYESSGGGHSIYVYSLLAYVYSSEVSSIYAYGLLACRAVRSTSIAILVGTSLCIDAYVRVIDRQQNAIDL